jgi:hypothetical protein
VTVPEIDGTFIELEMMADDADVDAGSLRRQDGPA